MKKILIVNNNLEVGGVQKSLSDLLWTIHHRYDVTLCLFSPTGVYMDSLPPDVRVIQPKGPFRYLGRGQRTWSGLDQLLRGGCAVLAKAFGRQTALGLMGLGEKSLPEEYDCAISFLHNGSIKNFYGGTQEYVLHKVRAKKKVAFVHCDYGNCGANHPVNNRLLARFDRIAACSDGCRRALLKVLPELEGKCVTVRNAHRYDRIRQLADQNPVSYPRDGYNVLMVSRLSHEKGIERALEAAACCGQKGVPVTLHLVGGGPMRPMLEKKAEALGISANVRFYGEQANPYRYMKNADLFLMTSFHEAAPMVLEEAWCLGLPMLTTETTSSREMVTERCCGWVCDNEQSAINEALYRVLRDREGLTELKKRLQAQTMDNQQTLQQFERLIEE